MQESQAARNVPLPPEVWERIQALFDRLRGLAPADREAALAREEDSAVRNYAATLLASYDRVGGFLEETLIPEPRPTDDAGATTPARFADRFELLRTLGRGGMGVVYEARQLAPERRVALKVLRTGLPAGSSSSSTENAPGDTPGRSTAAQRFTQEVSLLARLDHPSIARLHEAGVEGGPGGRPWFAMEFVPGALPLTEYVERLGASVDRRLDLYLEVCDAVHHGHLRGVIHRDLKPSNLLVSEAGRVVVIDFGVARAVDEEVSRLVLHTLTGEFLGTPRYMSPEQSAGDPRLLDLRTDVYSLGVVLFELLTGVPPYALPTSGLLAVARAIVERPARSLASCGVHLGADLETIVAKALEKDPERRYGSVAELAEDLRRFRAHLPIRARAPSTGYRLGRFLRRRRLPLAAGLLVALALVSGTVLAVNGRRRAEEQRQQADAALQFLLTAIQTANPRNAGRDATLRDMIDVVAERMGPAFSDRPQVEASLADATGRTYLSMGELELAEQHLQRALELRRAELPRGHPQLLKSLGFFSDCLLMAGENERALPVIEEALEQHAAAGGARDLAYADLLTSFGMVLVQLNLTERAESALLEAIALKVELCGDQAPPTQAVRQALAINLKDQGRVDEAEALLREVVKAQRASREGGHPDLVATLCSLGRLLADSDRPEQARQALNEALELGERVFAPDHPFLAYARGLLDEVHPAGAEAQPHR